MRRGKAVLALGVLAGAAALGLGGSMAAKRQPLPRPARYDLREDGAGPWIRDQGDQNTCWAFASVTALETSMEEEKRIPLSADHMIHKNSAGLAAAAGGDYSLSWAYLLSWQGPAAEADVPYGDRVSPEGLSPVCHVQRTMTPSSVPSMRREAFRAPCICRSRAEETGAHIFMTEPTRPITMW